MLADGSELVEGVAEAVKEEPLLVQREGGDGEILVSFVMIHLKVEEVKRGRM